MTLDHRGPGVNKRHRLGQPVTPSADPIDRVVRLAPPWTVFALVSSGLLVVGIVVWALTGTVTSSVSTPGFLYDVGATTLRASSQGVVDQVVVQLGDNVKQGQPVATLVGGTTLTAPKDGSVVSVNVSPGSSVTPGQSVAIVVDPRIDPYVVTKLPPSYISTVRVGLSVRMEVEGAPASQYGYLLGTLADITNDPFTNAQIGTRLGIDQTVVASELGDPPGLLAVIHLHPDPQTPTGYAWSVGQGPTLIAQQGVAITVHTIIKESTPLGVVFPQFDAR